MPEYNDDFVSEKATPDARKVEFDFASVYRELGEPAGEEDGEIDFGLLGEAFGRVLRWIVRGNKLDTIGRRAVALAWVINPDIFEGASATALAKWIGVHRETILVDTAEASRVFGIRNRSQQHGWNFEKGGKVGQAPKKAVKRSQKPQAKPLVVSQIVLVWVKKEQTEC